LDYNNALVAQFQD